MTQMDEACDLDRLVDTMTEAFSGRHRLPGLMMTALLLVAAAVFDLVDGAVSENPLLFIAGVLFSCTAVLLLDLWQQNIP